MQTLYKAHPQQGRGDFVGPSAKFFLTCFSLVTWCLGVEIPALVAASTPRGVEVCAADLGIVVGTRPAHVGFAGAEFASDTQTL